MNLYVRNLIGHKIRKFQRPSVQPFLLGVVIGMVVTALITLPSGYNLSLFRSYASERKITSRIGNHSSDDHHHRMTNISLSSQLYNEVKVLCWILTGPQNHEKKAKHVKATWGQRCNTLIFMSTEDDPSLPAVALPVIEDRNNLWGKTKAAFQYVYDHHYNDADWFFKADDDTYAVMENLRYLLRDYEPTDPIYFGFRFKPYVKQGYMSGGGGYVLSKESVKRFVTEALPNPDKCKKENTGAEDVEIGKCLENVGVAAGDSRDADGRSRFLPLFATDVLIPGAMGKEHWFWSYHYYPFNVGMECCSDNIITIHYVDPYKLYLLEYLIYHVQPFGISYNPELPEKGVKQTPVEKEKASNDSWDEFEGK
ncbi:glycoprotein-N-acetylgalactosamine 3-beta-galactosyltransferase 1-like isoform X2 [Sitophilus oryzae]|uniref:Glycoprotein-N-acetylgalactosamine 3-beta-galactosyltransferase 1 n=1 Tax=Sitophilus oryzae TaxID=7048 RepID=A0A6J2YK09_SITOR|nr:glycoprotein-N-acetylgalactosamine 3-beta-galactosyltransferase 1-like isoform X2 [Sitophilus oryzae]